MPRKTSYKHPYKHYAAQYGVHVQTVKGWAEEKYPLDDPAAMAERIASQKNVPASFLDCPDIQTAKLKKVVLECERIHIQNEKQRGLLISRDEVRQSGVRIGSILNGELAALLNDMPSVLAGLSQVEVRTKLSERIEAVKETVRKELAQ